MKKNKLTVNSTNKPKALPTSQGNASGALVSTSTKASGERKDLQRSDRDRGQAPFNARDVARFLLKLHAQKNPKSDDINRLHAMIVSTPAAWPLVCHSAQDIRRTIIERMHSNWIMRVAGLAETDILKQQLDYDTAPALERMQIDHLLTAWLRLRDAEIQFSHCQSGESFSAETARFRQEFLESAQARFLRASEALARIRRLARNTPALQINIAHDGGKQVNMQGDAFARGEIAKAQT